MPKKRIRGEEKRKKKRERTGAKKKLREVWRIYTSLIPILCQNSDKSIAAMPLYIGLFCQRTLMGALKKF